jgi:hypothetical protein
LNHLQHETSPYLLQHAHNPVEWYAWKPEAFARARAENKPIVVSIGYSTCHWCHVMERESFEDADTAAFMNTHFINIKVDREERPDVDQIYMQACQVINGNGGWPLNCFLLPDGKPFYAGTYYPPQPAHSRPSWLQLLNNMYRAYQDRREEVEKQAERLLEGIQSDSGIFRKEELLEQDDTAIFTPDLPAGIASSLAARFDLTYGGFGGAPKFPGSMNLSFLLDYSAYTEEEEALRHVHFSLRKMIGGGIYDQLGGGFARYTVDRAWLVPHFEKMLYDNALLVSLLSDAYRQSKDPLYAETIRETLEFVQREMTGPTGGFYAALDADSEGVEGKFYVWSLAEVEKVLGDHAPAFSEYYGVSEAGNWEGTNILWRSGDASEIAGKYGLTKEQLSIQLAADREKLLAQRAARIRPGLDDKHLLSWNALMISACCRAYLSIGNDRHKAMALDATAFVQQNMLTEDGHLWHTYKDGKAQYAGFLDDYAYWITALLDMYDVTFDLGFIDQAATFTEFVLVNFIDRTDNLFYFTAASQKDVPLRRKEMYDNAMPSGNATMVHNLQRLAILTGRSEWQTLAINMLKPLATTLEKYPTAFGHWAKAALYQTYPVREVAIVGPKAAEYARALQKEHYPNMTVMAHPTAKVEGYPLLTGRTAQTETLLYVCKNFQCQLPVRTVAEAAKNLSSL